MKVIRDVKKDGLSAEHSEDPTGPVPLSAARLGSKHIFTRNPSFVLFFIFFFRISFETRKLSIICLHWKVNISVLTLRFQCSTSSLGLLTEQVKLQLQARPSKEVDEAVQKQHFTSQKSVFTGLSQEEPHA